MRGCRGVGIFLLMRDRFVLAYRQTRGSDGPATPGRTGFRSVAEPHIVYIQMNIWEGVTMDRYSIAEARRNLPSLVREAENGKAVELTRRGEPVAVLLGHLAFERLASRRRGFGDAYREFAGSIDLAKLAIDPHELFGDVREESPGREVQI